jgi:hypothetical protein
MKAGSVSDLKAMLLGMKPSLGSRAFVFSPLAEGAMIPQTAFAMIREAEGTCLILPAEAGPSGAPRFACITLEVHSDLEAVGLTAAVATTLAASGIACNVIAGLHHDHLFVPWDKRDAALAKLEKLSLDAWR